jgi:hypothetical protein
VKDVLTILISLMNEHPASLVPAFDAKVNFFLVLGDFLTI